VEPVHAMVLNSWGIGSWVAKDWIQEMCDNAI
jgi:hypothetical protein